MCHEYRLAAGMVEGRGECGQCELDDQYEGLRTFVEQHPGQGFKLPDRIVVWNDGIGGSSAAFASVARDAEPCVIC